jgi:hypothetical protein
MRQSLHMAHLSRPAALVLGTLAAALGILSSHFAAAAAAAPITLETTGLGVLPAGAEIEVHELRVPSAGCRENVTGKLVKNSVPTVTIKPFGPPSSTSCPAGWRWIKDTVTSLTLKEDHITDKLELTFKGLWEYEEPSFCARQTKLLEGESRGEFRLPAPQLEIPGFLIATARNNKCTRVKVAPEFFATGLYEPIKGEVIFAG